MPQRGGAGAEKAGEWRAAGAGKIFGLLLARARPSASGESPDDEPEACAHALIIGFPMMSASGAHDAHTSCLCRAWSSHASRTMPSMKTNVYDAALEYGLEDHKGVERHDAVVVLL